MGLIHALGIDVRILLAQFFNFALLILILWYFAYRPVLALLEQRRLKINKGLDDAEAAEERLRLAEKESKKIINLANKKATQLIDEAQQAAKLRQQEILKKAEQEILVIMEKEKANIESEKIMVFDELKKEVSSLVFLGLQRFLVENVDEKRDQEAISKMLKKLT